MTKARNGSDNSQVKTLRSLGLLGVLYILLAQLCLMLAIPPGYSSPLWLPIGAMIVSLWIFPRGLVISATFIGALLTNIYVLHSSHFSGEMCFLVGGGMAIGSTLAVTLASFFTTRMEKVLVSKSTPAGFILLFLFILGPICSLVSSLIANATLWSFHVLQGSYFLMNWLHWWIGDSIGVLLTLPLGAAFILKKKYSATQAFQWVLPFFLTMAGLILVFTYTNHMEVTTLQQNFVKESDRLAHSFEDNVHMDIELLEALRGFYQGSEWVEEHEFQEFLESTYKRHRSLEQILWIPTMESKLYQKFYSFKTGDEHFEPYFIKDKIWKKIKDLRTPVMGPQIQTHQLLVFPVVIKEKYLGVLVGVMDIEKIMTADAENSELHNFEVNLLDQTTGMANLWKNGSFQPSENGRQKGLLEEPYQFKILDHDWTLSVVTTRAELFERAPASTLILLCFGLMLSYLICALQLLLHFRSRKTDEGPDEMLSR